MKRASFIELQLLTNNCVDCGSMGRLENRVGHKKHRPKKQKYMNNCLTLTLTVLYGVESEDSVVGSKILAFTTLHRLFFLTSPFAHSGHFLFVSVVNISDKGTNLVPLASSARPRQIPHGVSLYYYIHFLFSLERDTQCENPAVKATFLYLKNDIFFIFLFSECILISWNQKYIIITRNIFTIFLRGHRFVEAQVTYKYGPPSVGQVGPPVSYIQITTFINRHLLSSISRKRKRKTRQKHGREEKERGATQTGPHPPTCCS